MRYFSLLVLLLLLSSVVFANQPVHGTIANQAGKPVSDVQVILLRSYPEEVGVEIGRAVTGESGAFTVSFEEPPLSSLPASMHLVASLMDTLGVRAISNPRINQQITLRPKVSISGVVTDDKGRPISGASVTPELLSQPAYFGIEELRYARIQPALGISPAVADSNGEFRITGLPSGWDVSLRARKDGYEDGVGSGTITLKPGKPSLGWIMGKVSGLAVAGVRVTAARTDSQDGAHWTALTKSDGSFEFDSLPSGTYSLFVLEADQPVEPVGEIKVNANHSSHVTLRAVEGTLVHGRVVDRVTGEGIAGVMVISPGSRPVLSNPDGSFSIRMLPGPGILSVVGRSQGYESLEHEMDVPDTGEVTGIKLLLWHAVKVAGQVFESGKPVEGALIRLITENGPIGLAESDPDGAYSFVLEGLPKSVYLVAYNPLTGRAALSSIADITLQPPATLAGTVKDSAGKPIPNASVLPVLQVGRIKMHALHNRAVSDSKGEFSITGLIPDATYTFRIEAEGFQPATVSLDAELASGRTASQILVLTQNSGE
jgi:hypothetical protein